MFWNNTRHCCLLQSGLYHNNICFFFIYLFNFFFSQHVAACFFSLFFFSIFLESTSQRGVIPFYPSVIYGPRSTTWAPAGVINQPVSSGTRRPACKPLLESFKARLWKRRADGLQGGGEEPWERVHLRRHSSVWCFFIRCNKGMQISSQ